jgi:hypothetical protein
MVRKIKLRMPRIKSKDKKEENDFFIDSVG